jgi:SAM-dependent methyltransferase
LALEDSILSILKITSADQYSIFKKLERSRISDITKALANLQRKGLIHVISYRKSRRTGIDFPVYSRRRPRSATLDVHPLLAGVTSERLVEYRFVSRNLLPRNRRATILDIGSGGSELSKAVESFGKGKWRVYGIDMAGDGNDATMDARSMGIRSDSVDQVICISTIEHVGLDRVSDGSGDLKVMEQVVRVLKNGASAIISVPYAGTAQTKQEYRVYDRRALVRLAGPLLARKKEFYRLKSGKWVKCSQAVADRVVDTKDLPLSIHSAVCACLLLQKRN